MKTKPSWLCFITVRCDVCVYVYYVCNPAFKLLITHISATDHWLKPEFYSLAMLDPSIAFVMGFI